MKFINIGNFLNDSDDIILAKIAIEKELIELGIIDKKFNLVEFINWLDFTQNVYVINDKINTRYITIPFSIYKSKNILDNEFIFFMIDDSHSGANEFIQSIENIKFDINNLKQVDTFKMYENGNYEPDSNYFIIKHKLYIE